MCAPHSVEKYGSTDTATLAQEQEKAPKRETTDGDSATNCRTTFRDKCNPPPTHTQNETRSACITNGPIKTRLCEI